MSIANLCVNNKDKKY